MAATATAQTSAVIQRPIKDVWSFVADPRNEPRWHTDILALRPAAATDAESYSRWRLGDTLIVTVQFMGRREYEVEVTGMDEERRLELTTRTGPMRPTATYQFEPQGGATRFTRILEMPLTGAMRFMAPLIRRNIRSRNARFVANLKGLLDPS